jgi:putative ABC transport system permease protein
VIVGGTATGIGSQFPFRLMEQFGGKFSEMPIGNALFFEFSFISLFKAWLMGVVVASLFTLIPSLKSAFVEPVEALRR